jgi:hypothetical protein
MKTAALALAGLILGSGFALGEAEGSDQPDPNAWTKTPTRYLGKSKKHFVEAMRARLAISGRRTGPFGLPQDPTDEPQTPLLTPRKIVKKEARPFTEIVGAIPVSTINIDEKSFFVADRKFVIGQQFPIETRQESVKVRIDKVASTRIGFTNMKTGEYAEKRLDLLPAGVLPGGQAIAVPGVTAENNLRTAPLQLDLSGPVPRP